MSSDIVLRGEDELPAALSALLRQPPPDGVWYVPGHPPQETPAGITGLVVRALRWVVNPPRDETARGDDELEDGDRRFGLWLTEEHLLLADDRSPRAVRREDIVGLRVRRGGRRPRDLLVFELRDGRLHFPVDWLDGWAGRVEELRAEIEGRLKTGGSRARALEDLATNRQFDGFVRWLDAEVRRLRPDETDRARLLELTTVALSSWADETRRAAPEWFLAGEAEGGEPHRFAREEASWLLPLSRVATFDAASHFPDATSVADCALTFHDVPLTGIELDGCLGDGAFDAFLLWAGTKPLSTLAMSGANEKQRAHLAAFKREHGLS